MMSISTTPWVTACSAWGARGSHPPSRKAARSTRHRCSAWLGPRRASPPPPAQRGSSALLRCHTCSVRTCKRIGSGDTPSTIGLSIHLRAWLLASLGLALRLVAIADAMWGDFTAAPPHSPRCEVVAPPERHLIVRLYGSILDTQPLVGAVPVAVLAVRACWLLAVGGRLHALPRASSSAARRAMRASCLDIASFTSLLVPSMRSW